MNHIPAAKELIRRKIIAARSLRSNPIEDENHLTENLLALVERYNPERVATYLSFGSEPPTSKFLKVLTNLKATVLVPKVVGSELEWFTFDPEKLKPSSLGMLEPNNELLEPIQLTESDLLIVPALAVDMSGHRLGRGKGFFDRTLGKALTKSIYAVCFESELCEELPVQEHDRPVFGVVTESSIQDLN